MTRLGRIVVVTIGLVGAGILFGALAGGTALALVGALGAARISTELFMVGAFVGVPLGAVSAPLLAWLLLRRVPLGRMFLVCSVSTTIGGVVGWFATMAGGDIILNSLGGGFIGCLIAAIALWHRTRLRLET